MEPKRPTIAANWAALGILYNTGQDCTAGSRVYVQDTVYDKFLEILVGKAKQLVIADGFDEKAGGGPVVSHFPLSVSSLSSVSMPPTATLSLWQGDFPRYLLRYSPGVSVSR